MSDQKLKITIMGCGHSSGTPTIGNYWGNCDPEEPRNYRTRASVLIQSADTNLVIDTGPDMRTQINKTGIAHIDAVLYSHCHSDHISGIDELRAFRLRDKKITDIYGNKETIEELQERYQYLFRDQNHGVYPRVLNGNIITDEQFGVPMVIGDITFTVFAQEHGTCRSLGFRFGDVAYSTDFVDLDDTALKELSGVKTWIADGCAYKMPNNVVHANLKTLYDLNEVIQAERVIVHHLSQQMDYQTLKKELPEGFDVAYDGMELEASV